MPTDEDAEEAISDVNPFALLSEPQNEALYIEDPKKALRGYYEREGMAYTAKKLKAIDWIQVGAHSMCSHTQTCFDGLGCQDLVSVNSHKCLPKYSHLSLQVYIIIIIFL